VAATEAELQAEIAEIAQLADEAVQSIEVAPKRGGVDVRLVSLVWVPSPS
jgi:hypothetical protein